MIRGVESCWIVLIPSNSASASVIVSGALSGALSGSVVPSPQPTARAQSPPTRTPHAVSIFRLNIIYTCRFESVCFLLNCRASRAPATLHRTRARTL